MMIYNGPWSKLHEQSVSHRILEPPDPLTVSMFHLYLSSFWTYNTDLKFSLEPWCLILLMITCNPPAVEGEIMHFGFSAWSPEQVNQPICTKDVMKHSHRQKASENITAITIHDHSFKSFIRTTPRAQTTSNDTVIWNCFISDSQQDYRLEISPSTAALLSGYSKNNYSD